MGVWTMQKGGSIGGEQQYKFVDKNTERCLMRQSCHSSTSALSLGDPTRYWSSNQNCNHCGTKHWKYDADKSQLSEHNGKNCLQSDAQIKHCSDGYQEVVFVPGEWKDSQEYQEHLVEVEKRKQRKKNLEERDYKLNPRVAYPDGWEERRAMRKGEFVKVGTGMMVCDSSAGEIYLQEASGLCKS